MEWDFSDRVVVCDNSRNLEKPIPEILALSQGIAPYLEKRTFRQMSQVIFGMLFITSRVAILRLRRRMDILKIILA
jgi:hypothetical protein